MDLKEKWLEAELDNATYPPLVVMDYKVYAHQIFVFAESACDIVENDEGKLRTVIRALWAYRLNRGIDSIPPREFTALVVDDRKGPFGDGLSGYWRHIEAHRMGMPEYKGGRPEKPSLFPLILEEGLKYIKAPGSKFHFFDKEYYEADDIAGKISRIQREQTPLPRHILLSTVDGDWQGLVSDPHQIIWCSTGPWLPRIRTEAEVCDYYLRKDKLKITSARETYTVKVEVGDRGDNLMPGTPLRFFDLYEEDGEWGWTPQEEAELKRIMQVTEVSNRLDHLDRSKRFLQSIGMFLPEIPAPGPQDVLLFNEKACRERREALNPDLKGLNKKYCMGLKSDTLFDKCAKIAVEDLETLERIKLLENERKSDPVSFSKSELLRSLKIARSDYKASLIRFSESNG